MRRRTKRVRLRPRPFIVLGLLVNLGAGVAFSPVSAVRHVRVEGAPPSDETRLTGLLQALRGVPCVRVNARDIEARALQNSELRSANLARTPFGSAVLRVARRTPVAKLNDVTGLSDEGVVYAATVLPPDLPTVVPPPGEPEVGLTLGNGWPSADVAHLATLVRGDGGGKPPQIILVGGGRVCLNIEGGTVDLGRLEGLEAKVARMREILRTRPGLFATVQTLSLVRVDAPAFLPRPLPPPAKGAPKP